MKCVKCGKKVLEFYKNYGPIDYTYCKNKKCVLYTLKIYTIHEEPIKENWLQKLLRKVI